MSKLNDIIIVRRADEPNDAESPKQYAEASRPEVSGTTRMIALLLLTIAVAGLGGVVGLISYLAQL